MSPCNSAICRGNTYCSRVGLGRKEDGVIAIKFLKGAQGFKYKRPQNYSTLVPKPAFDDILKPGSESQMVIGLRALITDRDTIPDTENH